MVPSGTAFTRLPHLRLARPPGSAQGRKGRREVGRLVKANHRGWRNPHLDHRRRSQHLLGSYWRRTTPAQVTLSHRENARRKPTASRGSFFILIFQICFEKLRHHLFHQQNFLDETAVPILGVLYVLLFLAHLMK